MKHFYRVKGRSIVDGQGRDVVLHGVNLGGWLMPEGYFMQAPNLGYQFFRKKFIKECGEKAILDLEKSFRDNWVTEQDIVRIAKMGFNCIRVPFHYQLIEVEPYTYDMKGVAYLDRVIRWAKRKKVGIILDLHAAPGGQSIDWHCDSDGKARFWSNKAYQKRACALWSFLADRYKNNETVIGYDVLNEAESSAKNLNCVYHAMIKAIRSVDQNHIIFIEGNRWATDLTILDDFDDDNVALSIHYYEPIDFVFNLTPNLTYPLPKWGKRQTKALLRDRIKTATERRLPVLVGEFGVYTRADRFNESGWLTDTLDVFNELGLHRTYWTYKAIKNTMFPDGIYSYYPNKPWVNRHGPVTGWDTWCQHWSKYKKDMIQSWRTEEFLPNKEIVNVLKKFTV